MLTGNGEDRRHRDTGLKNGENEVRDERCEVRDERGKLTDEMTDEIGRKGIRR